MNLLINPNAVQALVHDVDPSILGRQDEKGHECLTQVVEIVLLVNPLVVFVVIQAVRFIRDVSQIWTDAVIECPLE
jgi:hypothetical protein